MTKLSTWKMACTMVAFSAAMAIAAPAQTFQILFTFNSIDGGATEYVTLTQGADGNFYGSTIFGGTGGGIFRITPAGKMREVGVCQQPNCADGLNPFVAPILATDGNFYGTTGGGGAYSSGTVYRLSPQGVLTTIYSFCAHSGCPDGSLPEAPLTEGDDGILYGTTATGGLSGPGCGPDGCGTVFKVSLSGKLRTLYKFCSQANCADGDGPHGKLVQASDGNFYGITSNAGIGNSDGTVYQITPTGQFSVVYKFCSLSRCADGNYSFGGLIQAADGNLYGTTSLGGAENEGTVFKMTLGGSLTTLYSFCSLPGCTDGTTPYGGLVQGSDGNFYGTTIARGGNGKGGTLFELTPAGAFTALYSFCAQPNCADGDTPFGGLLQSTNGSFYGVTFTGGAHEHACGFDGCGVVFSLNTGLGPFVTFVRGSAKVGQTGSILGQGFTGTTSVLLNGTPASFTVVSDTRIRATVPVGATTGYVTVTTPSGTLTSNVPFRVIP